MHAYSRSLFKNFIFTNSCHLHFQFCHLSAEELDGHPACVRACARARARAFVCVCVIS